MNIEAEFPPAIIETLFGDTRYKVFPGGRGGARSWSVARYILIKGAQKPIRCICLREFMSSMKDSVHRLLADQINNLKLDAFYTVGESTIKGLNGTEIRFSGIRTNPGAIKSMEGIDTVFLEEAENISKASYDFLVPTIRRKDAEFLIVFNPQLKTDETYQRFIINQPPNCKVTWLNYTENPWFADTALPEEMEYLKKIDYDRYCNIWLGQVREWIDGAVFANQIKECIEDNRLTKVSYDKTKPVNVYFDIGRDGTALWFAQIDGSRRNLIDHYENIGESVNHYIEKLNEFAITKKYKYGQYVIPHDGAKGWWGSELSIKEVLQNFLGTDKVVQLPRVSIEDRINAARMIFANCYFDEENTRGGFQSLRRYRFKQNTEIPVHDESSHSADSFCYFAMANQGRPERRKVDMSKLTIRNNSFTTQGSWMSR